MKVFIGMTLVLVGLGVVTAEVTSEVEVVTNLQVAAFSGSAGSLATL